MTKEEILSIAKSIEFPQDGKRYHHKVDKPLPETDAMLYKGWSLNDHHFTTEYHRRFVLPTLEELFHFGYKEEDFKLVEKMYEKFDISYLIPILDKKFTAECYTCGEKSDILDFGGLFGWGNKKAGITDYHRLYKYGHECSRVINLSDNSGRIIFVSGDSQMIPSIPVLCYYFKEVWYFDNRYARSFADNFKDVNFSDCLIAYHDRTDSYFTENNFK